MPLDACEDIEQGALASSVAGDEPHALPLGHTKGDAREEHEVAERLGQPIDLQVGD